MPWIIGTLPNLVIELEVLDHVDESILIPDGITKNLHHLVSGYALQLPEVFDHVLADLRIGEETLDETGPETWHRSELYPLTLVPVGRA